MNALPTLPSALKDLNLSVYDTLEAVKQLQANWPVKPILPKLTAATAEAARKYANDLEQYEQDMSEYKANVEIAKQHDGTLSVLIKEYLLWESGILDKVEDPNRVQKIWMFAYDKGHASGYLETFYVLQDICELL